MPACSHSVLNPSCVSSSGYRHWHADLRPDDTPLEAGLAFTCKMKSSIPFLGRDRLELQKKEGLKRRIVCFTIDESVDVLMLSLALYSGGMFLFVVLMTVGFCQ